MTGGSLDKYLREKKPSLETKLQFAKGAAKGLEYLHSRGVIHRDIAARNCLYDTNTKQVKIGDFRLSVHAKQYTSNNEKLPIKWLAVRPYLSLLRLLCLSVCLFQPEVLTSRVFTNKSDVYSFGVLLYEIFSNGMPPYHNRDTAWVQNHVINGGKLTMPEGTPHYIQKIFEYCCVRNPLNRWDMKRVVEKMKIYIRSPTPQTSAMKTANSTATARPRPPSH